MKLMINAYLCMYLSTNKSIKICMYGMCVWHVHVCVVCMHVQSTVPVGTEEITSTQRKLF